MRIIDITQEFFSCRLFPGDSQPVRKLVKTIAKDGHNLTHVNMCVHNGTHVDAPNHFVDGGKAIHEVDLSVFYGECTVAEFDGIIEECEIHNVLSFCKERLLLKGECELSGGAAAAIAGSHVILIGVEDQSVGNNEKPKIIHDIILGKGIIPLEGLDLSNASPGEYILAAFPLKMQGSDGSPVRAVLFKE